MREESDAQNHGAYVLGCRRLEEVGSTAGAVADVISHEVRYNGGVPGVVFGYSCLDLTHEVGTHVGRFRVNTAAQLGKKRDEARAEPVPDYKIRDPLQHFGIFTISAVEYEENTYAQETHGDDRYTRYRPAPERNPERPVETRPYGACGTYVSPYRYPHTYIACKSRAARSEKKRYSSTPGRILIAGKEPVNQEHKGRESETHHDDGRVLSLEKRLGSFFNRVTYLLHRGRAHIGTEHKLRKISRESQRKHAYA